MAPNEATTKSKDNDKVQLFLKEAGLESIPIDPSSLAAIKELAVMGAKVAGPTDLPGIPPPTASGGITTTTSSAGAAMPTPTPPLPIVNLQQSIPFTRMTSDLTQPNYGPNISPTNAESRTHSSEDDIMMSVREETDDDDIDNEEDDLITGDGNTNAATVGTISTSQRKTKESRQLVDRLDLQMTVLMDMQRQINELTATVKRLEQSQINANAYTYYTQQQQQRGGANNNFTPLLNPSQQQQRSSSTQIPTTAPAIALPRQQQQRPAQAVAPQDGEEDPAAARMPIFQGMVNIGENIKNIPNQIRESTVYKILKLFWELKHHYVKNLDAGLLFKILFVMAVLTARMSSSSGSGSGGSSRGRRTSSSNSDSGKPKQFVVPKLMIMTALVLIGFIIHSGYFNYFYIFFIKENFPQRIWNGEDYDAILREVQQAQQPGGAGGGGGADGQPRPVPPQQQGADGGAVNNANGGGLAQDGNQPQQQQQGEGFMGGRLNWRDTILGGVIAAPQQGAIDDHNGEEIVADGGAGGVAASAIAFLQDVLYFFGSFVLSIFPMWHPQENARPPLQPRHQEDNRGPGDVQPPNNPVQPLDDDDE